MLLLDGFVVWFDVNVLCECIVDLWCFKLGIVMLLF